MHAGQPPDAATGAVVAPISLSTTFAQTRRGRAPGLRVRPLRQPDPGRARGVRRLAGGRRPRLRLRVGPGRRGQRAAAAGAGRPHPARQRRLRRHLPMRRDLISKFERIWLTNAQHRVVHGAFLHSSRAPPEVRSCLRHCEEYVAFDWNKDRFFCLLRYCVQCLLFHDGKPLTKGRSFRQISGLALAKSADRTAQSPSH